MDASQFVQASNSADRTVRELAASVAKSQGHFWRMNSTFDATANYTKMAREGVSRYTEVLGKRVPEAADKAGGAISRLGAMMAATFTVAAITKVGQWGLALFNAGAQSEIMGLRYHVVFGEMTGDLDRWVQNNKTAFGEAQDDMEGYLAQVANMLIPLGMTVEQSAEVAKKVLEMANAWSVWSGGTVTSLDAADAVTKGLMGPTRGLIQLGMKIDDTSLEQALLAAGTADLTGEEKTLAEVQARLNLLVGRSGPAFEVAGLAMEGATGAARDLQFTWATLKDTIADMTAGPGGQGYSSS
jgi:hypothetical protein